MRVKIRLRGKTIKTFRKEKVIEAFKLWLKTRKPYYQCYYQCNDTKRWYEINDCVIKINETYYASDGLVEQCDITGVMYCFGTAQFEIFHAKHRQSSIKQS